MTTYNIELNENTLKISFGEPSQNDQIVKDATVRLEEMTKSGELRGGQLLKINRPVSIPTAFVLAQGKISEENRTIMAEASHAVILIKDESEIVAWKEFCESLNLPVVVIIFSDYHGTEDLIELEMPILGGKVHCLQRGVDASQREMVKALAKLLTSQGV